MCNLRGLFLYGDEMKNNKLGLTGISIFEGIDVRSVEHEGELWYSVIDVIAAVTKSPIPKRYWSDLKIKLMDDNPMFIEMYGNSVPLKLLSSDGKKYPTDCANMEGIFRILQSVPSPNAEPFKQWLAKTGHERVLEELNPSLAVDRAIKGFKKQGRDNKWITDRLDGLAQRNEITDMWSERGIKGAQFGTLTNAISKGALGVIPKEHKKLKGLGEKDNLRSNMTSMELTISRLGELATTEITDSRNAQGFKECKEAAIDGGNIAGDTRRAIEKIMGKPIVTGNRSIK